MTEIGFLRLGYSQRTAAGKALYQIENSARKGIQKASKVAKLQAAPHVPLPNALVLQLETFTMREAFSL